MEIKLLNLFETVQVFKADRPYRKFALVSLGLFLGTAYQVKGAEEITDLPFKIEALALTEKSKDEMIQDLAVENLRVYMSILEIMNHQMKESVGKDIFSPKVLTKIYNMIDKKMLEVIQLATQDMTTEQLKLYHSYALFLGMRDCYQDFMKMAVDEGYLEYGISNYTKLCEFNDSNSVLTKLKDFREILRKKLDTDRFTEIEIMNILSHAINKMYADLYNKYPLIIEKLIESEKNDDYIEIKKNFSVKIKELLTEVINPIIQPTVNYYMLKNMI